MASDPDEVQGVLMTIHEKVLRELVIAVKMLTTCPDINLGDLVYKVRECEGKGWDGPSVKQWSNGVGAVDKAMKKAEELLK